MLQNQSCTTLDYLDISLAFHAYLLILALIPVACTRS